MSAGLSTGVPPSLTLRGQLIGRDLPDSVWEHPCFRARNRYLEIFTCHPHSWCPATDQCTGCGVSKELGLLVHRFTPEQ